MVVTEGSELAEEVDGEAHTGPVGSNYPPVALRDAINRAAVRPGIEKHGPGGNHEQAVHLAVRGESGRDQGDRYLEIG